MNIKYAKYRKIYFIISTILIIGSLSAIFSYGLKPGIDFTGGSILEIRYFKERPDNSEVRKQLEEFDLGDYIVQPSEDKNLILRMKDISEDVHGQILTKLGKTEEKIEEIRFESIGPSIGRELTQKTKVIVILAISAMIIYIAVAFWKVQRPIKSWQYGLATLIALVHDILIPLGVFAVFGKLYGTEISIPVITALMTFSGYSINNVVVIFDRIRENLFKGGGSFEEIVDKSLNQTLTRQINTSITTLLAVFSLYFLGGTTLKDFSFALILGIIVSAYSSFFISAPILVSWLNWRQKRGAKK